MHRGLDPPHSDHPSMPFGRVPMLDSEKQVQQRLPIPLPRVMFGSLDEFDDENYDETEINVPAATPSASDPMDGDPKVPSSST